MDPEGRDRIRLSRTPRRSVEPSLTTVGARPLVSTLLRDIVLRTANRIVSRVIGRGHVLAGHVLRNGSYVGYVPRVSHAKRTWCRTHRPPDPVQSTPSSSGCGRTSRIRGPVRSRRGSARMNPWIGTERSVADSHPLITVVYNFVCRFRSPAGGSRRQSRNSVRVHGSPPLRWDSHDRTAARRLERVTMDVAEIVSTSFTEFDGRPQGYPDRSPIARDGR